jgi:hypothetical protein
MAAVTGRFNFFKQMISAFNELSKYQLLVYYQQSALSHSIPLADSLPLVASIWQT